MSKKTLRGTTKRAWNVFSKYIRLRDALRTTGTQEEAICITCEERFPINRMDAGHFASRRHKRTLFNEKNVHAQCINCNAFLGGEQSLYGKAINKMYGKGTSDKLLVDRWKIKKFTIDELEGIIEKYKEKYKHLDNSN